MSNLKINHYFNWRMFY